MKGSAQPPPLSPSSFAKPLGWVLMLVLGAGCSPPAPLATPNPIETVTTPEPTAQATLPWEEVTGEAQKAIAAHLNQQAEAMGWCPETPTTTAQVYRRAKTYVVLRLCQMAAYQGSYEVLAGDGTAFQRLTATVFDEGQTPITETELAGALEWDGQAGTLQVWNKARGAGDCGTLATYRLVGEGTATQLVLQRFQAKWECNGEFTPPRAYPQRYPTNTSR
ncbi:MAG: DUF1176 domain-containing protein [Pseudanabaenaceae cyanobacterium]